MCMHTYTGQSTFWAIRGQLAGVSSVLPPYGSWLLSLSISLAQVRAVLTVLWSVVPRNRQDPFSASVYLEDINLLGRAALVSSLKKGR